MGDALAEDDVEFRLLERRSHLVLHDLHLHVVAQGLFAVLDLGGATDVQPHGGIELQGIAARRGFGIAEHDADLLTQLVDEDAAGVRLGNVRRELAESLGHQARLKAHLVLAHLALDLRFRSKGRDGVDHHDVDGTAPDEIVRDFEGLLPIVRLGDEEGLEVHAQGLRIGPVKGVFRVDDGGDAARFLGLGDRMDRQGGFSAGFRAVDLDDPALGVTPDAQRMVQGDGSARDDLRRIPFWLISQLHDGTLPVILLDLVDRRLQCLQFGGIDFRTGFFFYCFSHNVVCYLFPGTFVPRRTKL